MYQRRLITLLNAIWLTLCWLLLIMMGARYTMFQHFVEPAQVAERVHDVRRMWLIGLRYDLRVAGMGLSPLLLCGLMLAMGANSWQQFSRWAPRFLALVTLIVASVAITNYYYYQTYHTYLDVFAFGLVEDDAQAVMANIWQDYPIILNLGTALLLALPPLVWGPALLKRLSGRTCSRPIFILYLLVALLTLFAVSRGSLGTFPLRRGNAQVSDLSQLNQLTPNGLMAMGWALKDRQNDIHFNPVSSQDGEQLLRLSGLSSMHQRTPINPWLAAHKPNVVMTLMESFGSNMLAFDDPESNDLLGSLRPHFQHDFLFRRFLSEDNGTAPSLAALFFHSPMQNISHSSAKSVRLHDTPFDTYQQAGYRNIFISPGNMMWRNLANYLPIQGVDEIYDQNSLMDRYPGSAEKLGEWGLPDEYAYRLAKELLDKATQPLFITILTVTNHPPYVMPAGYSPRPLSLTPAFMAHAEEGGIAQRQILQTYQYAADAFGRFVSEIKASPLAGNTVLAATGDHQMRRLQAFYPQEQMLDWSVPFYLYVPDTILAHTQWQYQKERVGSHKDIFPTLYGVSLSDTRYLAMAGRNMLAPTDDPRRAFGYNVKVWIDEHGAYVKGKKTVHYPWRNQHDLYLQDQPTPVTGAQQDRLTALPQLLRWQVNKQIAGLKG